MKQGTKDHIAGKLHKARGTVKEAAGQVNNNPVLEAKGRDQAAKTASKKARRAAAVFHEEAASRRIKVYASEALRHPANIAAGAARWPRLFADLSKALFFALLRMTKNFFSYVGDRILSIRVLPPYKKQSQQAA